MGKCRVLITLRHPVHFIESLYLQMLRASSRCAEHIQDAYGDRLGKVPSYFEIDLFLNTTAENSDGGNLVHLDLATAAESYAELFGAENISFYFQEQLVQEPALFITNYCYFLSIDPSEALHHTSGKRKNDRMTEAQLERAQRITRSSPLRMLFPHLPRSIRRKLLMHGLPKGPGVQVNIPLEWRERIIDQARASNRQLLKTWELDFEKFDYPI